MQLGIRTGWIVVGRSFNEPLALEWWLDLQQVEVLSVQGGSFAARSAVTRSTLGEQQRVLHWSN